MECALRPQQTDHGFLAVLYRDALSMTTASPRTTKRSIPDAPSESEEQLMLLYQSGNSDAFGRLYLRFNARLHRFLHRLVKDAHERDEVFQEIWLAVIRGKERYSPSASFAAFLFGIAHRRVMDRWRRHYRRLPIDDFSSLDANIEAIEDVEDNRLSTATPEGWIQNERLGEALIAAVNGLPPLQREAFLLQVEGELSLDDIARATQTSRETVKSRLRYGNDRLRKALKVWL